MGKRPPLVIVAALCALAFTAPVQAGLLSGFLPGLVSPSDTPSVCEATVKVSAGGARVIATAEGNGPVNALDLALRQALAGVYPELNDVELVDYKVRILAGKHGTDATTRVLVDTADPHRTWTTVGVHPNVIEASWLALEDAIRYSLLR